MENEANTNPVANATEVENPQLVKSFEEPKSSSFLTRKFMVVLVVSVFLGVGTGYLLSKSGIAGKTPLGQIEQEITNSPQKGDVFGSDDTKTFKDTTEGVLKEGGIDGEGQYHLERPGGVSQNVYLTSSVVDLSKLLGRKVKVWGETQKAQHAGWLMDVGRIEVL